MLRAVTLALLMVAGPGLSIVRSEQPDWTIPDAQLTPMPWSEVAGWTADDHSAAFDAFLASCQAIAGHRKRDREPRPIDAPLKKICREALALGSVTVTAAREFFEARFRAVRISRQGETGGFLTGYYEPIVDGSRVPTKDFNSPVYRRPPDLVHRSSSPGYPEGGEVLRRVDKNTYIPYYDRAEIEDGALDGKGLEICWLRDPIDTFFIQIQGSARVRLQDGTTLRLNYAARNGHPYTPVGRYLVQHGQIPKDEMSMDRIRAWMKSNPDEAKALRRRNRSFVFFRVAELKGHQEPIGAHGIPLTPGRSIAVDHRLHAYGTPFWVEAELPLINEASKNSFRRLMIAQDTGTAIVGPARADIYFGSGDEPGRIAGRIRHVGRMVILLPLAK